MYLSHYSLNIKPFSISPDSRFLWLGEKYSEALATLKYGIQENVGFLLLTGDIGTGKTALINRLIREIDVPTLVASIPDPGLSIIDFFNVLASEFNLNMKFNSKGTFIIFFKKFIQNAYSLDHKVLIIIDEAQRLSLELLEEIRQLSNIELDHIKLLNIFFVGQSEFKKILMTRIGEATRQRIAVEYHIEPLTQKETTLYIQHRLKVAGANGEIFGPNAIREIYNFSCGYPRIINVICNHSLLTGYSKGLKSINEFVIRECASELSIRNYNKKKSEDNHPFLHKENIQKANKTYKLQSGRNGNLLLSVISKEDENFIKYNLKTLCRVIKQNEPVLVGKEEKYTKMPFVIYFKHNSLELLSRELQNLDKIANYYLKHAKLKISVGGYTDPLGNYWYNKKLTPYRAEIVKKLLIRKGVSPIHIKVFGTELENLISNNVKPAGIRKIHSAVIEFPF